MPNRAQHFAMLDDVISQMADAIDAHSPAGETLRRLGIPMAEGVSAGLKKGLSRGSRAAQESIGALGGFMSELQESIADNLAQFGKLGGAANKAAHGPEFYVKIGRKGGARMKELAAMGRKAEAGD